MNLILDNVFSNEIRYFGTSLKSHGIAVLATAFQGRFSLMVPQQGLGISRARYEPGLQAVA